MRLTCNKLLKGFASLFVVILLNGCDLGFIGFEEDESVGEAISSGVGVARKILIFGPSAIEVGKCYQFTAQLVDVNETPVNANNNITVNLNTSASGGTVYADPDCKALFQNSNLANGNGIREIGRAIRNIQILAGTNSIEFFVRVDQAGGILVSGADNSLDLESGDLPVLVLPGSVAEIRVIKLTESPIQAGDCIDFELQAFDAFGNRTVLKVDRRVVLTSRSDNFNGVGCQGDTIGELTYVAGVESVQFSTLESEAGLLEFIIEVPESGVESRFGIVIPPAAARQIVVTGEPRQPADSCRKFDVTVMDATNVNVATQFNGVLSLSGGGNGKFFNNSTCLAQGQNGESEIDTISLEEGRGVFYFHSIVAEVLTLSASDPQFSLVKGDFGLEILAGRADHLTFDGPTNIKSGKCSEKFRVSVEDTFKNPVALDTSTVLTILNKADLKVYSDANCTQLFDPLTLSGGSFVDFYVLGGLAQTLNLEFVVDNVTPLAQAIVVGPGDPASLVWDPNNVYQTQVDNCHKITLRLKDGSGNEAPAVGTLNVLVTAAAPFSETIFRDAACSDQNGAISFVNTAFVDFYIKSQTVGTATVSAAAPGTNITAPDAKSFTFEVGDPALMFLELVGIYDPILLVRPSNGDPKIGDCVVLKGTATDAFRNPVNVSQTLVPNDRLGGSGKFFPNAFCLGNPSPFIAVRDNSEFSISYKNEVVEDVSLELQDPVSILTFQLPRVDFRLQPNSATQLQFDVPSAVTTDDCVAFTIVSKDDGENTSPVDELTSIQLQGANFFSSSDCSGPINATEILAGQSSSPTVYFKHTSVTPSLVLKALAPLSSFPDSTATIQVTPGTAAKLALDLRESGDIVAGDCRAINLGFEDAGGNGTSSSNAVNVLFSPQALIGLLFTDATCGTAINQPLEVTGTGATIYFKSISVLTDELVASASGLDPGKLPIDMKAGDPVQLTFTDFNRELRLDNCEGPFVFEIQDAFGNPFTQNATARTVNLSGEKSGFFFADSSCQNRISSVNIGANEFKGQFFYKNSRIESGITLAVSSAPLSAGTLENVFVKDGPTELQLDDQNLPSELVATSCVELTVERLNANQSPVTNSPDTLVLLNATNNIGTFHRQSDCSDASVSSITIVEGTSQSTFYFLAAALGTGIVEVSGAGLRGDQSGNVNVISGPPARMELAPIPEIRVGDCTGPYKLQFKDANGFDASVDEDTAISFVTGSNGGAFSFFKNDQCTDSGVVITADQTETNFYLRTTALGANSLKARAIVNNNTIESNQVLFNVKPGAPAKLSLSGSTTPIVDDCAKIDVSLLDVGDNEVPAPSGGVNVTLALNPVLGEIYTDSQCTDSTSSVEILENQNSQSLYFSSPDVGSTQLTASSNGLQAGSVAIEVRSAEPPFPVSSLCKENVTYPRTGLGDPTPITDINSLRAVASNGYYKLMNDLDLTGSGFVPLFDENTEGLAIENVVIDGNGKEIKGFAVEIPVQGALNQALYGGLFHAIRNSFIVNLKLKNVELTTNANATDVPFAGLLAGAAFGKNCIDRVSLTGGSISSRQNVGALIGKLVISNQYPGPSVIVSNSSNTLVSGPTVLNQAGSGIGGLLGLVDIAMKEPPGQQLFFVSNSAQGKVEGGLSSGVGGAIGRIIASDAEDGSADPLVSIEKSYAIGDVSGLGFVGGLVGDIIKENSYLLSDFIALISEVYSENAVSCFNGDPSCEAVGGLVGRMNQSKIENSYSLSSATGPKNVAGLVAITDGSSTIKDSFAAGEVRHFPTNTSSPPILGGLVARDLGNLVVNDAFWDFITTKQVKSEGGEGEETSDMIQQATFDPPWDFSGINGEDPIWKACPTQYPHFNWERCRAPLAVSLFEEIRFLCNELPRESETQDIVISATRECAFGQNDNLNRRNLFMQARVEQDHVISLPEDSVLCALPEFRGLSDIRYDDMLDIVFDRNVIAGTSADFAANYDKDPTFGFPIYNWLKIRGTQGFQTDGPHCLPNSTCRLPGHDARGAFQLTLNETDVQKVTAYSESQGITNRHTLKLSIMGDDDAGDCEINSFTIRIKADYVIP